MYRKDKKYNICVITSPRINSSLTPLSNIIDILYRLSNNLYVITGNIDPSNFHNASLIYIDSLKHKKYSFSLFSIFSHLFLQLKVSYKMIKLSKSVDLFLFFMAECFFLPFLVSKFLGKPVILSLASSALKTTEVSNNGYLIRQISIFSEKLNYYLADYIVLYSKNLIQDWNLEKYNNKILIAHKHFINFSKFKFSECSRDSKDLIGYIGRLSSEKGVINFLEAIPLVLKEKSNAEFLLIGEGNLKKQILTFIDKNNLSKKVKFVDWIPHEELPNYLAMCTLIVIPSYTEGLPNVMLESMACGTPVLATPVGSIPDIIKDEITGFIIRDNSSECIASGILRAMNSQKLNYVSKNAMKFVEANFTYEAALKNYRRILNKVFE